MFGRSYHVNKVKRNSFSRRMVSCAVIIIIGLVMITTLLVWSFISRGNHKTIVLAKINDNDNHTMSPDESNEEISTTETSFNNNSTPGIIDTTDEIADTTEETSVDTNYIIDTRFESETETTNSNIQITSTATYFTSSSTEEHQTIDYFENDSTKEIMFYETETEQDSSSTDDTSLTDYSMLSTIATTDTGYISTPHLQNYRRVTEEDICSSPRCMDIAGDMAFLLDNSLAPCSNFMSFACGGFNKKKEYHYDKDEDVYVRIFSELEKTTEESPDHILKVNKFFRSCYNYFVTDIHEDVTASWNRLMKVYCIKHLINNAPDVASVLYTRSFTAEEQTELREILMNVSYLQRRFIALLDEYIFALLPPDTDTSWLSTLEESEGDFEQLFSTNGDILSNSYKDVNFTMDYSNNLRELVNKNQRNSNNVNSIFMKETRQYSTEPRDISTENIMFIPVAFLRSILLLNTGYRDAYLLVGQAGPPLARALLNHITRNVAHIMDEYDVLQGIAKGLGLITPTDIERDHLALLLELSLTVRVYNGYYKLFKPERLPYFQESWSPERILILRAAQARCREHNFQVNYERWESDTFADIWGCPP